MKAKPNFFWAVFLLFITVAFAVNGVAGQVTPARQRAKFQNVQYTLHPKVRQVKLDGLKQVSVGKYALPGMTFKPGDIIVDLSRKTSFKVLDVDKNGQMILGRPTLNEVFGKFEIPEQKVDLTHAEYFSLQKPGAVRELPPLKTVPSLKTRPQSGGQKVMGLTPAQEKDKKAIEAKATTLRLEIGPKVWSFPADGAPFDLTLSGEIGFGLHLVAKYTLMDGYRFGLEGAEYCTLNAKLNLQGATEVRVPIIGFEIGCDVIGSVHLGLFVVAGVGGNFTISAGMDEGLYIAAGIEGGTFLFVPTSFEPYVETSKYFGAEFNPSGKINAHCYLAPGIRLEVCGCEVFSAELGLGVELEAASSPDNKVINYDAYLAAYFFITVIDERVDIFRERINIFSRHKKAGIGQGNYEFQLGGLCAYRNQFAGRVRRAKPSGSTTKVFICTECGESHNGNEPPESCLNQYCHAPKTKFLEDLFADKEPYNGPLTLQLYRDEKLFKSIPVNTDPSGVFRHDFADNPIKQGDYVTVAVPGDATAVSNPVHAAIPWKKIRLDCADFFEELIVGGVETAVDTFGVPPGNSIKTKTPKEILTYMGDVTILLKNKAGEIAIPGQCDEEGRFRIPYPVMPSDQARAVVNIKGFELKTEFQGASHNVLFNRTREDTDTFAGGSASHYLQHRFHAVNKLGTKKIDHQGYLRITLGKTSKALIDKKYVQIEGMMTPKNFLYFEYRPEDSMETLLYENGGTLWIRPKSRATSNPKSSGTISASVSDYDWRWDERNVPSGGTRTGSPEKAGSISKTQSGRLASAPIKPPPGNQKPDYIVGTPADREPEYSSTWVDWYHVRTEYSFVHKGYVFKAIHSPGEGKYDWNPPKQSMSPAQWAIFGHMISKVDPSPLSKFKPGMTKSQPTKSMK